MRSFSINIQGRVKNFNLPKNQPLVPLFEAIVNAIHAIGERKSTDPSFGGQIIIRILRDEQLVLDGTGELPQIQSFEIIDNDKAEHLRKVFNIDLSTYKWLFDKSFRNAGEHADERHALFSGCAGDYNVISKNTPENMRKEILTAPHIRTLDIRNWTYVTYDSKGRQISCDLQQLRAEAYMLLYQISTHSLLCNTKLTHIPTEKLLK